MPAAYEFKFERQAIAEVLVQFRKNLEAGRQVLKDPFKSHVNLVCSLEKCKKRGVVQERTWIALSNPQPEKAFEIFAEIVTAHHHFAAELKTQQDGGFLNFPCSGKYVTFCSQCLSNAPLPYPTPATWRHKCLDKAWCLPNSQKQPSMRFNSQGQIWVLDIPFHNHVAKFLLELGDNVVKRDVANHVWLCTDAAADQIAGFCSTQLGEYGFKYEKDAKRKFEERQKKFAALTNKSSEHHIAAFEMLLLLTPATQEKIKRIALASLHPDAGGDKDKFQAFAERWKVVEEKLR